MYNPLNFEGILRLDDVSNLNAAIRPCLEMHFTNQNMQSHLKRVHPNCRICIIDRTGSTLSKSYRWLGNGEMASAKRTRPLIEDKRRRFSLRQVPMRSKHNGEPQPVVAGYCALTASTACIRLANGPNKLTNQHNQTIKITIQWNEKNSKLLDW